jgi:hypothetical protein
MVRSFEGLKDPYDEDEYSAIHYDMKVVMQLLQQIVSDKRTN